MRARSARSSAGIGTSLAVELGGPATVSLVLLEVPEPVEDLAAPGPRRRGGSSLAQQLPGSLCLARLPGEDRAVHRAAVAALFQLGRREPAGKLR